MILKKADPVFENAISREEIIILTNLILVHKDKSAFLAHVSGFLEILNETKVDPPYDFQTVIEKLSMAYGKMLPEEDRDVLTSMSILDKIYLELQKNEKISEVQH